MVYKLWRIHDISTIINRLNVRQRRDFGSNAMIYRLGFQIQNDHKRNINI